MPIDGNKKVGRICKVCQQTLPKDQFGPVPRNKDGLSWRCKSCHKKYMAQYYKDNVGKLKTGHKKWLENNIQHVEEYRKEYNLKNVVQIRIRSKEQHKRYYVQHKEQIRERGLQYQQGTIDQRREQRKKYAQCNVVQLKIKRKKYYRLNKVQIRAKQKKYYKNNPEIFFAGKAKRRAALLQRTPKWLTPKQLQQIKDFYINCPEGMTVDHIYPLQGEYISGLHHPDNLQYLTKSENCSKQNSCPMIDKYWEINSD